jgi:hypothetical protein
VAGDQRRDAIDVARRRLIDKLVVLRHRRDLARAAGRTISLGSIAASVGLPRDGERFAWIEQYFAAKRRQYDAAG